VDRRITVRPGVNLHVIADLQGSKRPVLMVHGLASNARLWDGVAARLAATGHPVAAIDQRGHGRSSKPESGYDFGTLTDDLIAVLAALHWPAPVVAGQSWGGNVVLELAARHPSSIAGLVLVDGGILELSAQFADWPTCAAALAPPPLAGTPLVAFERMIRSTHPDWPEAGITGTLANMEVMADGTIRPWLSRENHMKILRHMWEHHPPAAYPDVKVPVRIMMAEDRSNLRWMTGKRDDVARAVGTLAQAEAHWIDGDHDLHAQHPAEVADLIDTIGA
jgi:pimeloyl-ACP methyl ester carboxylesterase